VSGEPISNNDLILHRGTGHHRTER